MAMASIPAIPTSPADVTTAWLSEALSLPVQSFEATQIGTGQVSDSYRLTMTLTTGESRTCILKLAAADPTSRASAKRLALYQREVGFYTQIAPLLPDVVAKCYHTSYNSDENTFALLLQDAGPARPLDDLQTAPLDDALLALTTLGKLHASLLRNSSNPAFAWLKRDNVLDQAMLQQLFLGYRARYRSRLDEKHLQVCARFVRSFDASTAAQKTAPLISGPIHGDYRLDNLLYGQSGSTAPRPLTVVDWQTVAWGGIMGEVAYFLGCSVDTALRRQHFDQLLSAYVKEVALVEPQLTLERAKLELRAQAYFGVVMAIVSPMMVVQTPRGDDMFMALIARHCELVLDLQSEALLPPPTTDATNVHAVAPEHEQYHAANPEQELWNESVYLDFIDPSQGIAGWIRLGLTPNAHQPNSYSVHISQRDQPLLAINDHSVPDVSATAMLATIARPGHYTASHTIPTPLQMHRVTFDGVLRTWPDPLAPLSTDPDEPPAHTTPVALDLTWTTAGTPYKYAITTRYEIPCAVAGRITVAGRSLALAGARGQRDDSWGVRDWWGMSWMWAALHLDDGSHLHGLDLQTPAGARLQVGYVQRGGVLEDLEGVQTVWAPGGREGVVAGTDMVLTVAGKTMAVKVRPEGHAPARLVARDGRVSLFDRAWCWVQVEGRGEGWAWVEWNQPAKGP